MCVAHVFMNQARILENPEVPTYNVDRVKFNPAEGEEAHQCLQDALAHSNDTKGKKPHFSDVRKAIVEHSGKSNSYVEYTSKVDNIEHKKHYALL